MMQKKTNECPYTAKNLPFGVRRRQGRPRLAPLAFIRATNFTSLLDIEDEAEHEDDVGYENVDINENENENIAASSGCSVTDTFSSGLGDSASETFNSLIPNDGINVNHISKITNDAHFNEFCARYEQSNPLSNPNSTSLDPIAYTNHLQSFTDYDFVNSVAGLPTRCFSFQPPSSSLPSAYIENNNISSPRSFHQMVPFIPSNAIQTENDTNENLENNTNEIDSTIVINVPKKRDRKPLSAEQKAENKLNREAAKRAKL
jgi:hypothetical protein